MMAKTLLVTLLFLVSLQGAFAEPPKHTGASVKEILAAWEKRQANIRSFHYECQLEESARRSTKKGNKVQDPFRDAPDEARLSGKDFVLSQTFVYSLCGNKIAWSKEGRVWNDQMNGPRITKTKVAFDGTYTRTLHEDEGPRRSGVLAGDDGPGAFRDHARMQVDQLAISLWSFPIAWLIAQGYDPKKMSIDEDCASGDDRGYVKVMMPRTGSSWWASVYVDPSRDYMPAEFVAALNGIIRTDLSVQYVRHDKIGWRVSAWTHKQFGKSGVADSKVSSRVKSYSINEPIAKEIFESEFPDGTPVAEPHGTGHTIEG
jgi:hypothetical protein